MNPLNFFPIIPAKDKNGKVGFRSDLLQQGSKRPVLQDWLAAADREAF